MSGYDCLNEKRHNSRRKVDSELATTTSVGSVYCVFQMCGAATAKARLSTVDSLSDGTTRWLALVERSVRRPGKSSTSQRQQDPNAGSSQVAECMWNQSMCKLAQVAHPLQGPLTANVRLSADNRWMRLLLRSPDS